MIDKTIFQFMLTKLNDATINTQGTSFRGNYVFVRYNDIQQMYDTSTSNAYDTEATDFTAMAEIVSQETAYVEDNNRSGWTKRFAFQFDVRHKDKNLAALQEVRDYLRANAIQSIVDDGTTYNMSIKVSRPIFAGNQESAGTIFTTYYMDFFADTIETGKFGNQAVHTMAINGGTLQSVILDQAVISSAITTNPSNDLTSETNTKHKPVARGVTLQFILNYDSTALNKKILGVVEGKESRTTTFDYRKVFDELTYDYEFLITGGTVVYKKGVVVQINFNGVEV